MDGTTGSTAANNGHVGSLRAADARTKLKQKIEKLRDAMLDGLVDREEPVRLLLAAMLAGEHMLLVGPPGTAKSEVARRLHGAVGGTYFERLLTRFSVPEELFGPLSLRELENDRYLRCTEGYLPTATVAFVDEVFKANSAILNSLLTILNERLFDNGPTRTRVPLVCLVGASNELPEGDELAALYDRFLVRYQVGPVAPARFAEMALAADTEWTAPDADARLTEDDLIAIRDGARAVTVPQAVVDLLCGLREASAELGLVVSDRRWKKIVKLLRAVALVDGRDEVTPWDFWVVSHCVWNSPEQRPAVQEWYEKHLGVDSSTAPERTKRVIAMMGSELDRMRNQVEPVISPSTGRPMYTGADGTEREGPEPQQATRSGELLYLMPAKYAHNGDRTNGGKGCTIEEVRALYRSHTSYYHDIPAYAADRANWIMETEVKTRTQARQWSRADIQECIEQVAPYRGAVEESLADLGRKVRDAGDLLMAHVIVPPTFREPALAGLRANQAMLQSVRDELRRIEDGFAKLPKRPERGL